MSMFSLIIIFFMGFSLFAVGMAVGMVIANSLHAADGDVGSRFGEAIKLWRRITERMDELTRRNIVGLSSLRDALDGIRDTMVDDHIRRAIDELIEGNRRMEREVRQFRSHPPTITEGKPEIRIREEQQSDSIQLSTRDIPKHAKISEHTAVELAFTDFIAEIATHVRHNATLADLLDLTYEGLQKFVSFQRMGYARIDHNNSRVYAVWCRSERPTKLAVGYSAPLSQSSLRFVAEQNRPRVLSNLPEYLCRHPQSHSTRLLVEEGFGSSLTCPISAEGEVVGFLFLTSVEVDCFSIEQIPQVQEVVSQIGKVIHGMDVLDRIAKTPVHDTENFSNLPEEPVGILSMRRTK